MEEQQEATPEPQFIKGFNDGYLLARNEPDLAAKITAQSHDHNPYFKGFFGGTQEYEKEVREWSQSFSKGDVERGDRDLGKDR